MDKLIIPAFLEVFKSNLTLFSLEELQDLARTLTSLEPHKIDTIPKGIQDWYKQRPLIRNEVLLRFDYLREIDRVSPREPEADDMAIQNSYRELREAVTEQIKAHEIELQQIQSDSKDES